LIISTDSHLKFTKSGEGSWFIASGSNDEYYYDGDAMNSDDTSDGEKTRLQALLDKGDTEDHARLTHNRVKAILSGCKFLSFCDVQPSRIQHYLAERRQSGLSIKSCNYYLTAVKSFFNWMVDDRRMCENPEAHLKGQNANTDIRRACRSLGPDEIRQLLETTVAGPERFGMSGYERSLLYRFAAETGLRANEVRKLKVGDFDFENMTVTVKAGYNKCKLRMYSL
jgi:integrase